MCLGVATEIANQKILLYNCGGDVAICLRELPGLAAIGLMV